LLCLTFLPLHFARNVHARRFAPLGSQGFFTKNRHLILTSLPRLLYVDPSTMTYKGTIPWSSKYPVSIKLIGDTKFDVLSMVDEEEGRERAYHLYVKDKEERDKWVEAINGMLK